jgi:hypothetical protein
MGVASVQARVHLVAMDLILLLHQALAKAATQSELA